jgi:hypothetical protein
MAEELEAIIDSQEAIPATSCICEDGSVSYLKNIISPIYETMRAVCDIFFSFVLLICRSSFTNVEFRVWGGGGGVKYVQ